MSDPRNATLLRNLAVPAVRYALGRRTYVVGDVTEVLIDHAEGIPASERRAIVRDIDQAEARDGLGDASDADRWRELRDALAELA